MINDIFKRHVRQNRHSASVLLSMKQSNRKIHLQFSSVKVYVVNEVIYCVKCFLHRLRNVPNGNLLTNAHKIFLEKLVTDSAYVSHETILRFV